ncbi:MAG TPA: helix-turn-helix transcriptional regulator [Pseudonocardiaceae bacterium]|nr:helix-turn-helix transcriptional regulator [Pseudonocardiaceae bacterium]
MDETVRRAVERAITTMRLDIGEPLAMDDLARSAMFSKYHFSRVFREVTGVSPGRFLSAVRLAEAKRLLRSTPKTVTTISHQVGYHSVSTFSTVFAQRVGIAPDHFRRFGGVRPSTLAEEKPEPEPGAMVRGRVLAPDAVRGPVFVGLFRGRICEGTPVSCAMLPEPGPFSLPGVPEGDWQLLAHCLDADRSETGEPGYVGCQSSVRIRPNTTVRMADIWLRPERVFDPPVLIELPPEQHLSTELRLVG